MAWMKVDDQLHNHRKTKKALRSGGKRRDAAPFGMWVLAGSWAAQNNSGGWVPVDELDRWDENWEELAERLVNSGYWWPEERDGEEGFGFVNWEEYNPTDKASKDGSFGNHKRWHLDRGIISDDCPHCPTEPDLEPESVPDIGGESGTDIGGESGAISGTDRGGESGSVALPLPLPRPDPGPGPLSCPPDAGAPSERVSIDAGFDDWYQHYPRKAGRGQAIKAYRAARKKTDHETLCAALIAQKEAITAKGPEFVPYPATWLNGERWLDETPTPRTDEPSTNGWYEPAAPPAWLLDPEGTPDHG